MVLNLRTGKTAFYTCSAREAVIAAYAQYERNDWSTWDYEEKYGHLAQKGGQTWSLGDWACVERQTENLF